MNNSTRRPRALDLAPCHCHLDSDCVCLPRVETTLLPGRGEVVVHVEANNLLDWPSVQRWLMSDDALDLVEGMRVVDYSDDQPENRVAHRWAWTWVLAA